TRLDDAVMMLTGLPRGGLQSRARGWRLVTVPRSAAGGGKRPAKKSHHGSRIRNETRTNAAKSPANAFLSQVAQICRTSAARQADIFRPLIRCRLPKKWNAKQLYSRVAHSGVRKLTAARSC